MSLGGSPRGPPELQEEAHRWQALGVLTGDPQAVGVQLRMASSQPRP